MRKLFCFSEKVANIIEKIAIALLASMVCLFFVQTIVRYFLNITWAWSEEVCRYLFIWSVLLESGIGISKEIHVGLAILPNKLEGRAKNILFIINRIVIISLSIVLIIGGISITYQTTNQLSASLGIPVACVYSASIVGGILLVYYSFIDILKKVVIK